MQHNADESKASWPPTAEDVIGSSPDRLDTFLTRLPRSFGRVSLLAVAVVAALAGLLIGHLTAPADPVAIATGPVIRTDQARASEPGTRLLTMQELGAIGEPATGGTYTRGSASAIPDPCSVPAPGDTGVSYVPGPKGATAVSFHVPGGIVTERLNSFADEERARTRLHDVVAGTRICQFGPGTDVAVGEIGPGLGDEYVTGSIVRRYASGSSSTVAVLLVRVGATIVEFSLTGPSSAAAGFAQRCLLISLAGLAP